MGRRFMDDLYYGRITPWERKKAKSRDILQLELQIENERDIFVKQLTERTLQDFENLEKLCMLRQEQENVEAFRDGMQLGARFMEEILNDSSF